MSVPVTLRAAVEADLPALQWMGLFARHRRTIARAYQAQQRGDGLMLLAVAAGFPVGQVWLDFARAHGRRSAFLWALRTFPPLCGTGIGTCLVRRAEAAVQARGLAQAELLVEYDNHRARRFYERLGWHVAGQARDLVQSEQDDGTMAEERVEGWRMIKRLPTPAAPCPASEDATHGDPGRCRGEPPALHTLPTRHDETGGTNDGPRDDHHPSRCERRRQ